ncbi:AraC family transcriptional regulator [Marinobacter mobilis]|uniref:AraC family transcriptional regulator n=1 Tax=Marinobacter mobilis TaxID=488533 RepID=UPI0035C71C7A
MKHFVRAGSLLGYPEQVRRYGHNPTELLQRVGFRPSVLHDPDLYIPYEHLAELLEITAATCQAPDFGLQLGVRQGLEAVGALGSALCLQRTVADAMTLMLKSVDFHARGVRIDTHLDPEWIELSMHFAFAREIACDQLTQLSMVLLTRGIEQLHGRPDRPALVCLVSPEPENVAAFEQGFGCKVLFGQNENRVRYPTAGLIVPVNVDPALGQRLGNQWRKNWQQSREVTLIQQVERAITALLPTGECNLDMVARLVSMHPRSLQHQLKEESSSFGEILKASRLRLACQHLEQSDISLTTLALNLGFSELAVFSRAFKQWTGSSPRAWRKAAS